jgi:hypothetical protein
VITVSLQGLCVARLAADATLLGLCPALSIMGGLMPEEARLQPGSALVLVEDREGPPDWLHLTSRYEKHRITVTVHAPLAAPPTDPLAPPPRPPAEVIMDRVEDLLDWAAILDESDVSTTLILAEREERTREMDRRRDPTAEVRVMRVSATWKVEFEYNF